MFIRTVCRTFRALAVLWKLPGSGNMYPPLNFLKMRSAVS